MLKVKCIKERNRHWHSNSHHEFCHTRCHNSRSSLTKQMPGDGYICRHFYCEKNELRTDPIEKSVLCLENSYYRLFLNALAIKMLITLKIQLKSLSSSSRFKSNQKSFNYQQFLNDSPLNRMSYATF